MSPTRKGVAWALSRVSLIRQVKSLGTLAVHDRCECMGERGLIKHISLHVPHSSVCSPIHQGRATGLTRSQPLLRLQSGTSSPSHPATPRWRNGPGDRRLPDHLDSGVQRDRHLPERVWRRHDILVGGKTLGH